MVNNMNFAGWREITLHEVILSANTGLDAIKRAPIVNFDTGIRCLRIQDVSQKKDFVKWGFSDVQKKNFAKFQLKREDIIIARTGATVGVSKYIEEDLSAVYNNGLIRLKINKNIALPKFILYSLSLNEYIGHIRSISGETAAQPNMKINHLLSYGILLPLLSEQKVIADTLSCFDDKIELNNCINKTLEEMAQAIFKSWFVDFEPFQNEEFEESKIGMIPKAWRVGSLSEFMEYAGGSQPPASEFINEPKEGYIRFVQIRDYKGNAHITFIPISQNNKLCNEYDILIARYGASLGRICQGLNGAYNVALAKVFPKKEFYREFLRCYLSSSVFYTGINGKGGRSAQAGFNQGDIDSFVLAIPPDEIVKKFNSCISSFYEHKLLLQKENKHLLSMRNSLLPKLMNGELRVPTEVI